MLSKDKRDELEMQIVKYRALTRLARDPEIIENIRGLIADLERKLRSIDK
jgi:hypothetical protein